MDLKRSSPPPCGGCHLLVSRMVLREPVHKIIRAHIYRFDNGKVIQAYDRGVSCGIRMALDYTPRTPSLIASKAQASLGTGAMYVDQICLLTYFHVFFSAVRSLEAEDRPSLSVDGLCQVLSDAESSSLISSYLRNKILVRRIEVRGPQSSLFV